MSDAALLLMFTKATWELLLTQDLYLGLHHPQRAVTLQDLSNGINGLLVADAQVLMQAFPQWAADFSQATQMEHAARKESRRIQALYQHPAE
jgi:hypothetical protein